jgi:predicted glycoside hydrolase/deacetylase ChbG (UPF0249 family)
MTGEPIIVCADDFALDSGVSTAIVQLAEQARLSATSAMSLSPHWPEHAQWLKPLSAHIDVGLHLDWTSPFAVSAGHGSRQRDTQPEFLFRPAWLTRLWLLFYPPNYPPI